MNSKSLKYSSKRRAPLFNKPVARLSTHNTSQRKQKSNKNKLSEAYSIDVIDYYGRNIFQHS
jgi:hypothetical protein